MRVQILKSFTAYPDGKRTEFAAGPGEIPKSLIDEAKLIEKGLVKPLSKSEKSDD